MSFSDFWFYPVFCIFFIILVLVQFLAKKNITAGNLIKKIFLLIFSFFIICLYDWRFCTCILIVIGVSYFGTIQIEKSTGTKRNVITGVYVSILVLFLGYFKYFNFFMENIVHIIGRQWTALSIILPIGISFYIFSAISYILDVNWGTMEAGHNLLDVALFLSFFSKIVCGPVVRASDFLPQLKEYRKISWNSFSDGIQIFVFGFFKKMVLANHICVFVDDIFFVPSAFNTGTVWLAAFSNILYLYFDFSGYSDMAIGITKILGYDIKENFNLPFIAANISAFWNRWHISLSSWLNDYVFNPLAIKFRRRLAEKSKEIRKKYKILPECAAVILTFLISGLWHGAGWTFIIWGLLHGLLSFVHKIYITWIKKKNKQFVENKPKVVLILDIILCYISVNMIQVFFRASSVSNALDFYRSMFTIHSGISQPYIWTFFGYAVLIIATVLAVRKEKKRNLAEIKGYYPIQDLSTVKGLTVFFTFCGLAVVMGYFGETYFAYGKF